MTIQHETVTIGRLEESLIKLNDASRHHQQFIKQHFKVSALEMQLVQYVIKNGPQKMKDVSEHFHIKLSTFTSIIDKAEKRKILKRVNSKEDRRVVFLDVTTKGRNLHAKYSDTLQVLVKKVESNLEKKAFEQFVDSLETFNRISLES